MSKRKTRHLFSLKDSYPRYMSSTDNVGNKRVEMELVDVLCITEGRIVTDSFSFLNSPDFSTMNPLTHEFIDEYFKLMKKLALCFEFISMNKVSRLLKLRRYVSFYPISFPEHLRYPDVNGFMEMQYGPMLMLMYYVMRYRIAAGEETARGRKEAYQFVKRIMQRMEPIVEKRGRLHGYYIKNFHQLRKRKSCGPIMTRAAEEAGKQPVPFVRINGLSFVLEEDVRSKYPEYLAKYPYNIKEVRGMGAGVALLDLINPMKRAISSWYNFYEKDIPTRVCKKCKEEKLITEFHRHFQQCNSCRKRGNVKEEIILDKHRKYWVPNWGPLYPAILFRSEPEKLVRTIDLSFFD